MQTTLVACLLCLGINTVALEPPPTFTVPTTPFERIDLIYAGGPTPVSAERTGTSPGPQGVYASDHAGVIATFDLENHQPDPPMISMR